MHWTADSECEGEGLYAWKRLGSAFRLALYITPQVAQTTNPAHGARQGDAAGNEGTIPIVTVDTRLAGLTLPMRGSPGRWFENAGAGHGWKGFRTKLEVLRGTVTGQAARSPRQLMILMDADVWNGGCSDRELLDRYRRVVSASGGAPVVVGGDPHIFPPLPGGPARFQAFRDRRRAVMRAFGLAENAISSHIQPVVGYNDDDYFYVNSGFLMGPAGELKEVLDCMWGGAQPSDYTGAEWNDQAALTRCFLREPQNIAIEYSSSIVLTTWSVGNILEAGGQSVRNKATKMTQCFIHGDGARMGQNPWPVWLEGLRHTLHGAVR